MNPLSAVRFHPLVALILLMAATAGLQGATARVVSLNSVFHTNRLAEMDATLEDAIQKKDCPGGVIWLERAGAVHRRALGRRAVEPGTEPMTLDTIFDVASLTKVIATTPCIMLLHERGRIDLDAPVSRYLPGFTGEGRERITLTHLLTHTSGLRPGIPKNPPWSGREEGIRIAIAEEPDPAPGTAFRYSDVNFILLGAIVEKVSGEPLNKFAEREVFKPLGMKSTRFLPPSSRTRLVAPTERQGASMLRGVVHDPTSRLMGGVAGHAGLFSTASDLARFARMMLGQGELEGFRLLKAETVRRMTGVASPSSIASRRGLGWDIDSGYSRPRGRVFPLGSFGHTGFTGTAIWMDPFSKTFWILLSNRVHPDGKGNVLQLQTELGTLAAQAVRGFDFEHVPGALPPRPDATGRAAEGRARVLNGIDVLVRDGFQPVKGLRLGLITNHTGHDQRRRTTIDLLHSAPGVSLKALFSPEHGIRGQADEKVGDSTDETTGLPVHSLYGDRRAPSPEQLEGLDALVFDIQDIGTRYYTYVATLGNCMEAASRKGIRFIVLDRVNPINGVAVEGPVHTNASTFVAYHRIPLRHGMTVGELAGMFREERGWKLDLQVVRVEGWARSMWFDQTGLPWTNPSPNMKSMAGAMLYPALGFHEAALAVGRGTESPFQRIGAPWVDDVLLARELSQSEIPGVEFMPIQFQPTYSTFKGRLCGGVAIHVTDRDRLPAVALGVEIARVLQRLHPQSFALEKLRSLLTDGPTLEAIRQGKPLADITAAWTGPLQEFKARRAKYLIYP